MSNPWIANGLMNTDQKTSFLTYYIQSLGERTREETRGTKFGFDWIIYNLGVSQGWSPHRLPFFRGGPAETSTTKTEAEFGIDLAFLSSDRKTLRIFALKDEVLNNGNWGQHNFHTDLQNASNPNLSSPELAEVTLVEVILAYNKDEDANGIRLFDNLVSARGTKVGDDVQLHFDRWNLTRIGKEAEEHLLTPAFLPQKFYSHFSYICAQFADFRHGSDEWTNQLKPNWRRFLNELLSEKADERCVRLTMRRSGLGQLPFIDGHNSIDLVLEFVATGERPHEFCDSSSVYLMCLLELICSLPPTERKGLLENVYRRLVLAQTDEGTQMNGCESIDLMLWIPPDDWGERVLTKTLSDEGECANIHFGKLGGDHLQSGQEINDGIMKLVAETRAKRKFEYPKGVPGSVIVLGCLKHRSPLPPELWRSSIFGQT